MIFLCALGIVLVVAALVALGVGLALAAYADALLDRRGSGSVYRDL